MTISLRLEKEQVKRLEQAAKALGVSKSEFVRTCLDKYLADEDERATVWERGGRLFGRHGSGQGDLSSRCEQIARDKVHAKARPH